MTKLFNHCCLFDDHNPFNERAWNAKVGWVLWGSLIASFSVFGFIPCWKGCDDARGKLCVLSSFASSILPRIFLNI